MKPPKFQFARATSIDDVVRYLDADESAKVIAGGQSLVALMNFRLATPSLLVDISRIDDLGRIEVTDTHLVIGAAVRQRTAETSDDVRAHCALIPQALGNVGHVQIRNRGTVVGSIVHADPASELPAVALALGADLLVSGPGGSRVIAAHDFFVAPYWTTLEHGEFVTAVRFPRDAPGTITAVEEYARRTGDFAIAGVAVHVTGPDVSMAAFGVGATPIRLSETEQAASNSPCSVTQLRAALRADVPTPTADGQASTAYRRELLATVTERALQHCNVQVER